MASLRLKLIHWINTTPALRRMLMLMRFGDRDVDAPLFGLPVRLNTVQENGYLRASQMCQKSSLLRDEVAVLCTLSSLLRPNTLFVDAGANVGLFSSMMARLRPLYPDLKVAAFEVDPLTHARLSENAKTYGFEAHNVGLSDQEVDSVDFTRGAVSGATSQDITKYSLKGDVFQGRLTTLDTFGLPDGKDLIIKIDVEGHELEVIKGAEGLINSGRVKAIFADGIKAHDAALAYLAERGYRFVDARTLEPADGSTYDVLALHETAEFG